MGVLSCLVLRWWFFTHDASMKLQGAPLSMRVRNLLLSWPLREVLMRKEFVVLDLIGFSGRLGVLFPCAGHIFPCTGVKPLISDGGKVMAMVLDRCLVRSRVIVRSFQFIFGFSSCSQGIPRTIWAEW